MRRQAASLWSSASPSQSLLRKRIGAIEPIGRRNVRIYATPSSSAPAGDELDLSKESGGVTPDAKFEVLGAPFSLLSVQLSPSQNLYTRRGTLVSVSGKAENAVSTLSLLSPLTRAPLGIPFLYQRVSSSTPLTALLATKSSATSFAVVHLDGRLDWMVAQRNALLAWTGHNLIVRPRWNTRLGLSHWGNTSITGRGLVALVGKGQVYQVSLREGEEYILHPSHVLAYSQNGFPPQPYRFRSSTLRLQIPSLGSLLPNTKFFNEMKKSQLWNFLAETLYKLRTWTRRTVWGDRLFLQFKGPGTVLVQSRGGGLRDSLSREEVDEIADAPAGVVRTVLAGEGHANAGKSDDGHLKKATEVSDGVDSGPNNQAGVVKPASVTWATVSRGGKVDFKEGEKV